MELNVIMTPYERAVSDAKKVVEKFGVKRDIEAITDRYKEDVKKVKEDILKYGIEEVKAKNIKAQKQKKPYARQAHYIDVASKQIAEEAAPKAKKLKLVRRKKAEPKPAPKPKSKKILLEDSSPFGGSTRTSEPGDKVSFAPQQSRKPVKPKSSIRTKKVVIEDVSPFAKSSESNDSGDKISFGPQRARKQKKAK
jgi:hypothetical protein